MCLCFSYTYTHILFLKLFSIKSYYKVLTIGPCVCVCAQSLSHVRLCDLWIVARQTPPSMGILQARILEWVACPPPGNSPKPGIETVCPALQADSYRLSPRKAHSGGNRLVDTGKRSTTSAPEAWARVGKLSFIGCRRGSGKSHHGNPPCVQLCLDPFPFRPAG